MPIPKIIKNAAHQLRTNMTCAEKNLWGELKNDKILGKRCIRQKPIPLFKEDSGYLRYIIADFVYLEDKLIIELDGSIHNIPEILELDQEKEILLKNLGYRVLRFKNEEVLQKIKIVINTISKSLQPSVFRMKEGDSEEDYEKIETRQKKRFTMINDSFTCENCKKEIPKHPSGSARNHCPFCLYSKHLDKDFPGDRVSTCLALMKPIGKDYHKNKGWMVVHECIKCGKKIPNKLAEDDSVEVFGRL